MLRIFLTLALLCGQGNALSSGSASNNVAPNAVPLIGPIPMAPPLMIGSELVLSEPTPLQWKALSCAATMPLNSVVDAAPIVAVIDDISGKYRREVELLDGRKVNGRYATLAAVVGVKRRGGPLNNNKYQLDESSDGYQYCRLLGVGRCIITTFKNYIALDDELMFDGSDAQNSDYAAYYFDQGCVDEDDTCEIMWDDAIDDSPTIRSEIPIVIAEFEVLNDLESGFTIDEKSGMGRPCSPVHAMSAMHSIMRRVEFLHEHRKTLVSGLKAAQVRLEAVELFETDEDLFRSLAAAHAVQNSNDEVSKVTFETDVQSLPRPTGSTDVHKKVLSRYEGLKTTENYGLDYYSSFSTLEDLTKETMERLAPFYSDDHCARETYWMEAFSFVAWKALDGYTDEKDAFAWALRCTSTVERLDRAYAVMMDHRSQLEELVKEISKELRECGEECTDLW